MERKEEEKNFRDRIKVAPDELNYDLAQMASRKQEPNRKEQINVENQQRRQPQRNAPPNKGKRHVIRGAFLFAAAVVLTAGIGRGISEIREEKERQKEIARLEQVLKKAEKVAGEYDKIEDITQTLQKAKAHYEMGLNAEGEPITEENMNEELENIKELIKDAYKMRIGEAYGVKPEDTSKIRGEEESILNLNDVHIHVVIPEDISPTGERIDLMDEQVPENMANLIRVAGSIKTGLNYDYNDPNMEWARAMTALESAITNSKMEYTIKIDGKDFILVGYTIKTDDKDFTLVVDTLEENNKSKDEDDGLELG